MNNKSIWCAVATLAIAAAAPTMAQTVAGNVNFGNPIEMVNGFARGCLAAMGGCMSIAGCYKGIQVWSGGRSLYEAGTWLLGGGAMGLGTAALIGFN